jgi:hypothetical protein
MIESLSRERERERERERGRGRERKHTEENRKIVVSGIFAVSLCYYPPLG